MYAANDTKIYMVKKSHSDDYKSSDGTSKNKYRKNKIPSEKQKKTQIFIYI